MPKENPPPKAENETAFQKFQRLAQRIVAAPKSFGKPLKSKDVEGNNVH